MAADTWLERVLAVPCPNGCTVGGNPCGYRSEGMKQRFCASRIQAAEEAIADGGHGWIPDPGTGWMCPKCLTEKRVRGVGELNPTYEYRKARKRKWLPLPDICKGRAL